MSWRLCWCGPLPRASLRRPRRRHRPAGRVGQLVLQGLAEQAASLEVAACSVLAAEPERAAPAERPARSVPAAEPERAALERAESGLARLVRQEAWAGAVSRPGR